MRHLQRGEDFALGVVVESHLRDFLDQRTQGDEVNIAVDKLRARRILRLLGQGHGIGGGLALPGRL